MITNHDKNIIKFIETLPCYSDTIAKMFYSSQRAANRRLTYLYEYGCINRNREHASKKYFYWGKGRREPADKHKKHFDLIAKAYIWVLEQEYNILNMEVQKKHGSVRPDLLLHIEQGGRENILPVEVECTNNVWSTVKKYEDTEFRKLLLFSKRPFNRKVEFIEVIDIRLSKLM